MGPASASVTCWKCGGATFSTGGITVKQNKTGKRLWVPIVPALQEALDAAPRRSLFILTNHRATNRWSYRGASQAIRKIREDFGALDFDNHSWR